MVEIGSALEAQQPQQQESSIEMPSTPALSKANLEKHNQTFVEEEESEIIEFPSTQSPRMNAMRAMLSSSTPTQSATAPLPVEAKQPPKPATGFQMIIKDDDENSFDENDNLEIKTREVEDDESSDDEKLSEAKNSPNKSPSTSKSLVTAVQKGLEDSFESSMDDHSPKKNSNIASGNISTPTKSTVSSPQKAGSTSLVSAVQKELEDSFESSLDEQHGHKALPEFAMRFSPFKSGDDSGLEESFDPDSSQASFQGSPAEKVSPKPIKNDPKLTDI